MSQSLLVHHPLRTPGFCQFLAAASEAAAGTCVQVAVSFQPAQTDRPRSMPAGSHGEECGPLQRRGVVLLKAPPAAGAGRFEGFQQVCGGIAVFTCISLTTGVLISRLRIFSGAASAQTSGPLFNCAVRSPLRSAKSSLRILDVPCQMFQEYLPAACSLSSLVLVGPVTHPNTRLYTARTRPKVTSRGTGH